ARLEGWATVSLLPPFETHRCAVLLRVRLGLFPLVAGEHRRHAEADEQRAADIALELEVAPAAAQPLTGGAGDEGVAAVGDEAQQGEEQAEEGDLACEMPARRLDELRQESEEEQRGLGVEQVDDEAVAEQARVAVARDRAAIPGLFGAAEDLLEAE